MVAEFAEVDSTGHLITICVIHMIVFSYRRRASLRRQLCSRRRRGEHKYPCQMVVVGSHIICVKYILSLLEHSLREIAYVSELGLSSDLVTKSFGPRASG